MKTAFERAADTADILETMLRQHAYADVACLLKSFDAERCKTVFDYFSSTHASIVEPGSDGLSFVEYAAAQKDTVLLKLLVQHCSDDFHPNNSDILEQLYYQDEDMLMVVLDQNSMLEQSFNDMRSEERFEVQGELDYLTMEGRIKEASCFATSWLKKSEIQGMIPG